MTRPLVRTGACLAPVTQLYLFANGDVGPCCRTMAPYGNVATTGLSQLWRGAARARVVAAVDAGDLSQGCERCGPELAEGRAGSTPATFDHVVDVHGISEVPAWPIRMEFELGITCNLACIQCTGELSSRIRRDREHRAPLPPAYGDDFFEELVEFLPHLRAASFTGGEPFLVEEHHRVWDLLAEVAPHVACTIVTNATIWDRRVERVSEQLVVTPVISFDGATARTYESIRLGADHARVVRNIDRWVAYARSVGTVANLNVCVMPQNVAELPDLLVFAEERDMVVNPQIVRTPPHCSLAQLPPDELAGHLGALEARDAEMERRLSRNLGIWRQELARLEGWVSDGVAAGAPVGAVRSPKILMFRVRGHAATDPAAAQVELVSRLRPDVVHGFEVGPDELARHCTPGLERALGMSEGDLEGHPLSALWPVVEAFDVVESSDDRYRASFRTDGAQGELVLVPRRGPDGRADAVAGIVGIRQVGP